MSGSINKVILIGNLGSQPEIRNTQNGDKVASFTLATNERWKDQQGQRQERTEWHRIVIFGGLTQIVEQYLNKGAKIYIEGQLRTRKWQDQQGVDKYTTEVVLTNFNGTLTMLDGNPNSAGAGTGTGAGAYASQQAHQPKSDYSGGETNPQSQSNDAFSSSDTSGINDLDDDIPF